MGAEILSTGDKVLNAMKEMDMSILGLAALSGVREDTLLDIMAGIREKIEYNDISESFQGTPIVLVTATLMAIAFCGFSGLI